MTVFKCYMKILRQNIGLVIMYLAIFFSVAIVMQFAAGKSEDSLFETASIDLGVVNEDGGTLAQGLVDYLSGIHHVVLMDNDPEQLQENLFYRNVEYILQIPAVLCRQTDLLVAAAKTGKTINIKKGQFLSPLAMQFAADKVVEAGNKNVMLTERGTTFGYQDLVVDYRGIPEMQTFGYPVILDVTHSLQQPNQTSGVTGGMPQLIETVAKAGVAVGVDGIFIETHENPAVAKSDGANMLKLDLLEDLLTKLVRIREAIK